MSGFGDMAGGIGAPTGGSNQSILREFLIKLGYKTDESTQRRFVEGVTNITKTVVGLGAAVATAAVGVVAGMSGITKSLSELYYTGQRTGSSTKQIEAFAAGMAQVGSSTERAQGLVESFGEQMSTLSGQRYFRAFTGEDYKEAVQGIEAVTKRLREMQAEGHRQGANPAAISQRLQMYGKQFNLTREDILALLNPDRQAATAQALAKLQNDNLDKMAKGAVEFENRLSSLRESVRVTMFELEDALNKSIGGQLESITKTIEANRPAITKALADIGTEIAKISIGLIKDFAQIKQWYDDMPRGLQILTDAIAGITLAVYALNLALSLNPITRIVLAIIAAGTVIADFVRWLNGATDTMIPWTSIVNLFKTAWANLQANFVETERIFGTIGDRFVDWKDKLADFLGYVEHDFTEGITKAWKYITDKLTFLFQPIVDAFNKIMGWLPGAKSAQAAEGQPGAPGGITERTSWWGDLWHQGRDMAKRMFRQPSPIAATELPDEAKAFLQALSLPESGGEYDIRSGGGTFNTARGHPGQGAAGRYQFLPSTWLEESQRSGLGGSMDPANQDRMAWSHAQYMYRQNTGRDLLTDLKSGQLANISHGLNRTWVSLPGGSQSHTGEGQFEKNYVQALPTQPGYDQPGTMQTRATLPNFNLPAVLNPLPIMPYQGMGSMGGGGDNSIDNSTTHHHYDINVSGVSDPRKAADIVMDRLRYNRQDVDTIRNGLAPAT